MTSFVKKLLTKPSATVLAQQELEEAQRQLLRHQAQNEYHASMVKFYEQNIKRLSTYVQREGVEA